MCQGKWFKTVGKREKRERFLNHNNISRSAPHFLLFVSCERQRRREASVVGSSSRVGVVNGSERGREATAVCSRPERVYPRMNGAVRGWPVRDMPPPHFSVCFADCSQLVLALPF
jgi:hypothetical protein